MKTRLFHRTTPLLSLTIGAISLCITASCNHGFRLSHGCREIWECRYAMGLKVLNSPSAYAMTACSELAREAAYKGCNVYIRISGYSTQVNDQWIWTNRTNARQNLMYTVSVNLAGYDDVFITSARVRSAIMTVTSFSRGTATHGKLLPQSCSRARWIKRVKTGRWKTIFSTLAAGAMSANREANARIT